MKIIWEELVHLSAEERVTYFQARRAQARGARSATPSEEGFNLSTAENVLLFTEIKSLFEGGRELETRDIKYPPGMCGGSPEMLEYMAQFLSDSFGLEGERRLCNDQLAGLSGATAALEALAFALFAPGDALLILTPHWQGFDWPFTYRPKLSLIRVPLSPAGGFELTLEVIQAAYEKASQKPKGLVLTNPNNPLGVNYPRELLEKIYRWVLEATDMHILSDEIYAHSQTSASSGFTSALALDAAATHPEHVHVVWGFAKDFGLSGFKVAFAISRAPWLRERIVNGRMSFMSTFDALKEYTLGKLLPDGTTDELIRLTRLYQERLRGSFDRTRRALERNGIEFHKSTDAAQFFWLDLRRYLPLVPPASASALHASMYPELMSDPEGKLADYIQETANVFLVPGKTMYTCESGFFRLCYTALEPERVEAGVDALGACLRELEARRIA